LLFDVGADAIGPQCKIAKSGRVYPSSLEQACSFPGFERAINVALDFSRVVADRTDQLQPAIKILQHPRPNVYGVIGGIDP